MNLEKSPREGGDEEKRTLADALIEGAPTDELRGLERETLFRGYLRACSDPLDRDGVLMRMPSEAAARRVIAGLPDRVSYVAA